MAHKDGPINYEYVQWDTTGWTMETVALDRRGRITIPKERLEELGIAEDDRLVLVVQGGELHLKPLVRRQVKVKARRRWGREAFPRSREALFGDE